jgi:hypothetical protein
VVLVIQVVVLLQLVGQVLVEQVELVVVLAQSVELLVQQIQVLVAAVVDFHNLVL